MISEGSCDTEDWSNDAENSALHHRKKIIFKIYSNFYIFKILNGNIISQYFCFNYFDQMNVVLVNIKNLFRKHLQKCLNGNNNKIFIICVLNISFNI